MVLILNGIAIFLNYIRYEKIPWFHGYSVGPLERALSTMIS